MKATWFGTRPSPMKFAGTAVEGGGRGRNGGRGKEGKEGRERKVTKSDTAHIVYCTITNSVVGARPVSIVHTQGDVWGV